MNSFSYLEPVYCSMSSSNCCFLTCIQISQEAGQVVCYSISFRIFHSSLWSTQSKARRGRQRMRWLDGITDSMEVSESAPGVGDGQGGLACCDSWGRKGSDTTERLNWTDSFPKCLIRNVISMFCGLLQEYIKTQTPSPCHPQSSCSSPFLFLSLDSEQRKCKDSDSYSFFSHSMTAYLSSLDQSVYIICISINFPVDPVSNHLSPEFFLVIATKLTSML